MLRAETLYRAANRLEPLQDNSQPQPQFRKKRLKAVSNQDKKQLELYVKKQLLSFQREHNLNDHSIPEQSVHDTPINAGFSDPDFVLRLLLHQIASNQGSHGRDQLAVCNPPVGVIFKEGGRTPNLYHLAGGDQQPAKGSSHKQAVGTASGASSGSASADLHMQDERGQPAIANNKQLEGSSPNGSLDISPVVDVIAHNLRLQHEQGLTSVRQRAFAAASEAVSVGTGYHQVLDLPWGCRINIKVQGDWKVLHTRSLLGIKWRWECFVSYDGGYQWTKCCSPPDSMGWKSKTGDLENGLRNLWGIGPDEKIPKPSPGPFQTGGRHLLTGVKKAVRAIEQYCHQQYGTASTSTGIFDHNSQQVG